MISTSKKNKNTDRQLIIRVDRELATKFKVICARRDISMNKMIARFIRKTVRTDHEYRRNS